MKKIVTIFAACIILLLSFALSACSSNDGDDTSADLVLNRSTLSMVIGDVYTLTTSITPKDMSDCEVSWKNSNAEVILCENGKITAIGIGNSVVEATIPGGSRFVCRIEVKENLSNMYVLEGECKDIRVKQFAGYFDDADYISTDASVLAVSEVDGFVRLEGLAPGKTHVKLCSGDDVLEYRQVIVIPKDTLGVQVDFPDLPVSTRYEKGNYVTEMSIYDIQVDKNADSEFLDAGMVRVNVTFKFKKTYDSDGNDAKNPVAFVFELYSGEADGMLRSYRIVEPNVSVNDFSDTEKELSYTYSFDAVLDMGDGARTFTFVIENNNGK